MEIIVDSPATVTKPDIVVRVTARNSLETDELLLYVGDGPGIALDFESIDPDGTTRHYKKDITLPSPALGETESITFMCVRGRRKGYPGAWSEEFEVYYNPKLLAPELTLYGKDVNGNEGVITENMRVFGGEIRARIVVPDSVKGDVVAILKGFENIPDSHYAYAFPTATPNEYEVVLRLTPENDYKLVARVMRGAAVKLSERIQFVCLPSDPRFIFDTFTTTPSGDLQDSGHNAEIGSNWLLEGRWLGSVPQNQGGYNFANPGVVAQDRVGDIPQRWAWNNKTRPQGVKYSVAVEFELTVLTAPVDLALFVEGRVDYGRSMIGQLLLDGLTSQASVYYSPNGQDSTTQVSLNTAPGRHTFEMLCADGSNDYTLLYDGVVIGQFVVAGGLNLGALGFSFLPRGNLAEFKLLSFTAKERA